MKKLWIFLIVIIVLGGGVFYYLKYYSANDFEPLIKAKLQQVVKDGSDGLYTLDLEHIKVDVIKSQVFVYNARLIIDSARLQKLDSIQQAPNDIYKVSFKSLVIDGIGPEDLVKKNTIDLNTLIIDSPSVEIFHQKRAYNYIAPDTMSLYNRIAKEVGHLAVKNLSVRNVDFVYHNFAKKDKRTHFENVNLAFKDVLIDSTTKNDSTRFFYAKDARIFLKDYYIATADSLYNFHIDSLTLYASSKLLELTGISLRPKGKKEDFSKKLSVAKDRFDISVKSASIQQIDWWQLLSEDGFEAKKIELTDGKVEVYADRTLPPTNKSKVGNYPHQLLMRMGLPVMIEEVDIKNFDVVYSELNDKTKKKGSISFNNTDGKFTNITNIPEEIAVNKFFALDAHTHLMSVAPLHAVFKFDLSNAKNGNFSVDLNVGAMDGKKLNEATIPLGMFQVKSADIDKIEAHMTATNYRSSGTVMFLYKNLEVEVLKQDDNDKGKFKKRGLITFIANSFIIEKNNTATDKNKDPKKVTYQRDPKKSFFNLIWKTIFTGLANTVKGANE